jgi:hypothetical protein
MSEIGGADFATAEPASGAASDKPRSSWRDHLKVHPAAELFPLMSESELRELGENIRANGLQSPIVLTDNMLLDGRNRLDAMELVGIKFELRGTLERHYGKLVNDGICVLAIEGDREPDTGIGIWRGTRNKTFDEPQEAFDYAISANIHRRHLTSEQKRDLIAKVLKAKPEASNAAVAKQTKATDKTVAKVRRKLESTSEIPKLNKTVGADGKRRKSPVKKKPDSPIDKLFGGAVPGRVTESAEVSIEDHRAEMTRLDEPSETAVDEADRRVRCVTKTILRHVEGLSRSETERFFDGLRDWLDDNDYKVLRGQP